MSRPGCSFGPPLDLEQARLFFQFGELTFAMAASTSAQLSLPLGDDGALVVAPVVVHQEVEAGALGESSEKKWQRRVTRLRAG